MKEKKKDLEGIWLNGKLIAVSSYEIWDIDVNYFIFYENFLVGIVFGKIIMNHKQVIWLDS
jgi:hypothetical protein